MRTGMSELVSTLRGMTNAGTADYSIAGVSYWSDEEMERALDRHRVNVFREELYPREGYVAGGSIEYTEYLSRFGNLEQGTAALYIQDSVGSAIGTADYSVDYALGVVTFTADQAGSARYLQARSYNLNAAAADVWRMKAGHAASKFDFSTDGHTINRSQMQKMAMDMVRFYEEQGGAETVEIAV